MEPININLEVNTNICDCLLLFKNKIKIHFAHRTFKWSNEAKSNAGVSVVIIGFSNFDSPEKRLFEYEDAKGEAHELKVKNINPYLVEGNDILIQNRKKPVCQINEIVYGSFALDDGNYTLSEDEKDEIVLSNPDAAKYIKPFIGGRELLYSEKRYCLLLLALQSLTASILFLIFSIFLISFGEAFNSHRQYLFSE